MDQIFKKFEIVQFIATGLKSIPKLAEMQSLEGKCCKTCKIWPYKFANFVYFSITHDKLIPLSRKGYHESRGVAYSIHSETTKFKDTSSLHGVN
jgi:hypothetical protein